MKVGIDLGTTYSSVAYYDSNMGKPVVIKNKYKHSGTPSVLCFDNGEIFFGEEAKEMQEFGDGEIAAFYKRNMGNDSFRLPAGGKTYSAEDLSAIYLEKLVKEAEELSGQTITDAVITVPAYFNDYQKTATKNAGIRAGINVVGTLHEPTAAAIAFGLDKLDGDNTYLVYDLGGGTFDVTIVKISPDGIEAIGTDGDHLLGGKDWDDRLANYLDGQFKDEFGFSLFDDPENTYQLLLKCENAKKELSERMQTTVSISAGGERVRYTITREEFNQITDDLMEKTRRLCESLLSNCNYSWSQLTGAILVGGSTRMAMVKDFVRDMSGKEPVQGINVDEAVALGAAIWCEMLTGATTLSLAGTGGSTYSLAPDKIKDVIAHALGRVQIKADRSRFYNDVMINENSRIPCSVTKPMRIDARFCASGESEVYVLQGSCERPLDNTILKKHVISGIDTKGRKEVIIDVTYNYDRDGIVNVEAVQQDNGKKLDIRKEPLPDDLSWLDGSPDDMKGGTPLPVTVLICIDASGSMYGCMNEAKKAAKKLLSTLDTSFTSVGLISFASNVHEIQSPIRDVRKIEHAIDRLDADGGTEEPLSKAYSILSKRDDAKKYIVVLTDGSWSNSDRAINVSNQCRHEDIEIIAVGIGSANGNFLRKISTMDNLDVLTDIGGMVSTFSSIGQEIASRSSSKGIKAFF